VLRVIPSEVGPRQEPSRRLHSGHGCLPDKYELAKSGRSETVLTKVVTKLDSMHTRVGQRPRRRILKTPEAVAELRERVSCFPKQSGSRLMQMCGPIGEKANPAQAQTLCEHLGRRVLLSAPGTPPAIRPRGDGVDRDSLSGERSEVSARHGARHQRPCTLRLIPPVRQIGVSAAAGGKRRVARAAAGIRADDHDRHGAIQSTRRSHHCPPPTWKRITAQFTRATNHVNELETKIQAEVQKLAAVEKISGMPDRSWIRSTSCSPRC